MGSYESPDEFRFAEAGDGGEESPAPVVGPGAPPTGVARRVTVGRTLAVVFLVAVGVAWLAGWLPSIGGGKTGLAAPASSPPRTKAKPFDCSGPKPSDFWRFDPLYSPEITDIKAIDRTTVRVRWAVRHGRADVFFVSRACPDGWPMNTARVSNTAREYVFSHLDPATAPYCFNVDQFNSDYDLVTETRCVSPPG